MGVPSAAVKRAPETPTSAHLGNLEQNGVDAPSAMHFEHVLIGRVYAAAVEPAHFFTVEPALEAVIASDLQQEVSGFGQIHFGIGIHCVAAARAEDADEFHLPVREFG